MYKRTAKMKRASRVPNKPILDIDKSFYVLPANIQNKIIANTLNIFRLLRSLNEIVFSPNVHSPFLKSYEKKLFVPLRIKEDNVKVFAYRRGNYVHIRVKQ